MHSFRHFHFNSLSPSQLIYEVDRGMGRSKLEGATELAKKSTEAGQAAPEVDSDQLFDQLMNFTPEEFSSPKIEKKESLPHLKERALHYMGYWHALELTGIDQVERPSAERDEDYKNMIKVLVESLEENLQEPNSIDFRKIGFKMGRSEAEKRAFVIGAKAFLMPQRGIAGLRFIDQLDEKDVESAGTLNQDAVSELLDIFKPILASLEKA